jgi:hypothetical protein
MDSGRVNVKPAEGTLRLTRGRKWLVFTCAIGVWLTGALWLVYKSFMRVPYEFGLERNPLESVWQILHGGFSFAATFVVGLLWGVHVVRGWSLRWRRWSGGTLFGVTAFLILSGGALYYVTSEDWQNWIAIAHWAIGLAALLVFFLHWLSRARPRGRSGSADR